MKEEYWTVEEFKCVCERERDRSACKREDQTAKAYNQITPGRARSELWDQ